MVSVEDATLILTHDDSQLDAFDAEVEIAPIEARGLPSILGRDMLERYRLTFSPRERLLTLDSVTQP